MKFVVLERFWRFLDIGFSWFTFLSILEHSQHELSIIVDSYPLLLIVVVGFTLRCTLTPSQKDNNNYFIFLQKHLVSLWVLF